jgi:hypothetical protein
MINRIMTVLMVSLALLSGTNAGASNLQNGILQYKWSDSASSYTGLSKLDDKGEVSYYSKPGEIYVIGDVSVEKVIYGFYMDQLFGVYLNIDSLEVYDKLLLHLKSQYGLPEYKTTAENMVVYKWKQQDVTIKLKMNQRARKMKLAFYYRPLSSKLNAKQWEKLDNTSFRFVPIEKDKKPEKFILFKF